MLAPGLSTLFLERLLPLLLPVQVAKLGLPTDCLGRLGAKFGIKGPGGGGGGGAAAAAAFAAASSSKEEVPYVGGLRRVGLPGHLKVRALMSQGRSCGRGGALA